MQPLLFFFFFSFLFPSLLWFWSFSGLRNMPFDAFSLKWLQISLGWFSKNRLEYACIYLITPYQVKIWQGILLLYSFVLHNLRSTPQMKWANGSQDYNSSVNTLIIIQCCFHRFYRVAKADLKFFNRNLLTCLHEVISWFHLFSVARWGLQVIKYFSHRQKLHRLEERL